MSWLLLLKPLAAAAGVVLAYGAWCWRDRRRERRRRAALPGTALVHVRGRPVCITDPMHYYQAEVRAAVQSRHDVLALLCLTEGGGLLRADMGVTGPPGGQTYVDVWLLRCPDCSGVFSVNTWLEVGLLDCWPAQSASIRQAAARPEILKLRAALALHQLRRHRRWEEQFGPVEAAVLEPWLVELAG